MSSRASLWIGLGLALWAGGAIVTLTPPRGIRNNNPMNVRRSRDQWLGMRAVQTDPEYVEFIDMPHGLRAGGRVLLNYASRYGLNTPRAIIARYAPQHENPTDAYIANVARRLNIGVDEPFDVARRLRELMHAIVVQENGASFATLHVPPSAYDTALMLLGLEVR